MNVGMIISLAIFFALFVLWLLNETFDGYVYYKQVQSFSRALKDTIKHSQPSWEDVKELALTTNIRQRSIINVLRKYYTQILSGHNEELEPYKDLIKGYMNAHSVEEPFDGLPNEIRIHLERLRDNIGVNKSLLEPLTTQIKDLLLIKNKEMKHQKYYTIGGFFLGVVGLGFTLFSFYYHPNQKQASTTPVMHNFSSATQKLQNH